jgi:putative transposase
MTFNSKNHHRKSIRLRDYDYSQAAVYFITACTYHRECLFGEILSDEMRLNHQGVLVAETWKSLVAAHPNAVLDEWVVMPNHFHAIVILNQPVGAIHESPITNEYTNVPRAIRELPLRMTVIQRRNMLLSKLIGRFKMLSSKYINESRNTSGTPLWQRNYWERVVRDEKELHAIREYIGNNPRQWHSDQLHP